MSEHLATIRWSASGGDYAKGKYSRAHTWTFDGGATVPASSSPSVVPPPGSDPAAVDPEEAFVASVASCHMLTFLYLAQRAGFEAASYEDAAVGTMAKNDRGVPWVASVVLSPKIAWRGAKLPTPADTARLHEGAHEQCFIANSVRTEIRVNERR